MNDILPSAEDPNEQDHAAQLAATGFWGREAAGGLLLARDTGRLLIAQRSDAVQEPNTWGTWGGAVDAGETPFEAMLRELNQEAGYDGPCLVLPLAVFSHPSGFCYSNFLVVVDQEFEPTLNWETQAATWCTLDTMPSPLHLGVEYLLAQSGEEIARCVERRGELPPGIGPEMFRLPSERGEQA